MRAGGAVSTDVYLEVGTKRTFACAVDWPGWSRSGRDDASALDTLVAYGPRYAAVLRGRGIPFSAPTDVATLRVVERSRGDTATDFGVPGKPPAIDESPLSGSDLARCRAILQGCWDAFDKAVTAARGRRLRVGPRGGGRTLARIVDHVIDGEAAYIAGLGGKASLEGTSRALPRVHEAALAALEAAARGEFPRVGPRGGRRWSPRYFARRAAWHVLDHAWEIEDRITPLA